MRIKDISKLNSRLLEKNKWKKNKQIDNSAYEQFDLAVDYHQEDKGRHGTPECAEGGGVQRRNPA